MCMCSVWVYRLEVVERTAGDDNDEGSSSVEYQRKEEHALHARVF